MPARTRTVARLALAAVAIMTAALPCRAFAAKYAVAGRACSTLGATSRSSAGVRLDCVQARTKTLWEPVGNRWNPASHDLAPATTASGSALEAPVGPAAAVLNQSPVDWANDLVDHITEANADYDHGLGPVTWAGQNGATAYESRTDCSGFILALYQQSYGVTLPQLGTWLGRARPLAASFADTVTAQRGYQQIQSITDVQVGDLIAVRYPNATKGDNTGHLMLVVSTPTPRSGSAPVVTGTTQWDVVIVDQSSTGHGPTDTRHHPDKTFASGVGRGTMRLYADAASQAIAGYSWSTISVSPYFSQADRPLVIGRLDPTHAW